MLSHKGERVTHLKALSFFWAMAPPPDLPAVCDVKISDDVIFSNPGAIFQVYRTPLKKSGYNVKIPLSFHKGAFFKSFLQNYEMTT